MRARLPMVRQEVVVGRVFVGPHLSDVLFSVEVVDD